MPTFYYPAAIFPMQLVCALRMLLFVTFNLIPQARLNLLINATQNFLNPNKAWQSVYMLSDVLSALFSAIAWSLLFTAPVYSFGHNITPTEGNKDNVLTTGILKMDEQTILTNIKLQQLQVSKLNGCAESSEEGMAFPTQRGGSSVTLRRRGSGWLSWEQTFSIAEKTPLGIAISAGGVPAPLLIPAGDALGTEVPVIHTGNPNGAL